MADSGKVTVSAQFRAGEQVALYPRVVDTFSRGRAVKTAKADKSGDVQFTGLPEGGQYWVHGKDSEFHAAVTAKGEVISQSGDLARTRHAALERLAVEKRGASQAQADALKRDPLAGSAAPGETVERNVVTGARNTRNARTRSQEPQPGLKQEDVSGVTQRSDTAHGVATIKDPNEFVPAVPQSEVPASTPQRSYTELGEATIKDPREDVPTARQEDVPSSTPQRSATETGEAAPKPKSAPREENKRLSSSAERARGHTPQKPEETVKPKGAATKTTKTGTKKRAAKKAGKKTTSRKR